MIEITTGAAAGAAAEMRDLFAIDGKTYQIPKPRAGMGLQFLAEVGEQGLPVASAMLLKKFVGAEGFAALTDNATDEQINAVLDEMQDLVLGSLEDKEEGTEESGGDAGTAAATAAPKKAKPTGTTGKG